MSGYGISLFGSKEEQNGPRQPSAIFQSLNLPGRLLFPTFLTGFIPALLNQSYLVLPCVIRRNGCIGARAGAELLLYSHVHRAKRWHLSL